MEDKAYTHLFYDIYNKVLQLSKNPSQFAKYLTLQIRELIGTRTVVIAVKTESGETEIFSVYPQRRIDWASQSAVIKLVELSLNNTVVQYLDREKCPSDCSKLLTYLDIEKIISIPLIVGNSNIGSILLLDILDDFGIESVIHLLEELSGVFALVIRNAYLYHDMENLVNIRTAELQSQNSKLLRREQELQKLNEEYQVINEELTESINKADRINGELVEANLRAEQSELQARKNEVIQRKMVANIGDVIVIIDSEGINRYKSTNIEKWFGWKPEELVDKSTWDVVHPEDSNRVQQIFNSLLKEENNTTKLEFRYLCKDGTYKWIEFTAVNLIHDEVINGVLGNYHDIDERKKTSIELVQAKERAEESDRLKTAFLTNMSHEIRTPMNGILGFTDLLLQPNLGSEEQETYIKIVRQSGQRMLSTVNDIVEISRIEAGIVTVDLREVHVQERIHELIRFFTPEATKKGLKLILEKELPVTTVITTDQNKLDSILTNLIKNAIKYTPSGEIRVGCEVKAKNLEFYVKDTGIGIPKERQQAVFERFVQADLADIDARQGSGLGLAITKAYVDMLGGEIGVESKDGKGSMFHFTLPLSGQALERTEEKETGKEDEKTGQIKGLKIIIAEDDETSALYLQTILEKEDNKILLTKNGRDTVEACRNNPDTDLILIDIQMPEMNGYNATREIRKFNKNVILIAQTAFALTGDYEKAIEAGCNDYITKPIEESVLLEKMQKFIQV